MSAAWTVDLLVGYLAALKVVQMDDWKVVLSVGLSVDLLVGLSAEQMVD